jgi:hypothetical protein
MPSLGLTTQPLAASRPLFTFPRYLAVNHWVGGSSPSRGASVFARPANRLLQLGADRLRQ